MTTFVLPARRPLSGALRLVTEAPWTLGVVLASLALTLLAQRTQAVEPLIATRAGVADGQLWRLVTGVLIHSNLGQLARDAVAFTLLSGSYEPLFGKRWPLLLFPALVIPTGAFLLLQPELPAYYGLSGAVYAVIAVAFLVEWTQSRGRPPRWIVAFSLVTLGKLIYESATGRLLIPMELGQGVVPAPAAHIVGLAVGAAGFFAMRARSAAVDGRT